MASLLLFFSLIQCTGDFKPESTNLFFSLESQNGKNWYLLDQKTGDGAGPFSLPSPHYPVQVPGNLFQEDSFQKHILFQDKPKLFSYLKAIITFSEPEEREKFTKIFYLSTEVNISSQEKLAIRPGRISDRYELYFNGFYIGGCGKFHSPRPECYDKKLIIDVPIPLLREGKNQILLRIQNYFYKESGVLSGPLIFGHTHYIWKEYLNKEYIDLFLILTYFLIGLHIIVIFSDKRKFNYYLYFSLFTFSLVAFLFLRTQWKYNIVSSLYHIKKVEYLLLTLLFPLFSLFFRNFLKYKYTGVHKFTDLLFFLIFLLMLLHPSTRIWNFLNYNAMQYLNYIYVIINFNILIKEILLKNKKAIFISIGSLSLLFTATLDILQNNLHLSLPTNLSQYGFFLMILSITLILNYEQFKIFKENETLLKGIEQKYRELNGLYKITKLFSIPDLSVQSILQTIVKIVPNLFHPERKVTAKISLEGNIYTNSEYTTKSCISRTFDSPKNEEGTLQFCFPEGQIANDNDKDILNTLCLLIEQIIDKAYLSEKIRLSDLVIDSAIEGIVVTDSDSYIEFVNPAFTKITGYTSKEILGKKISILKSDRHDKNFYRSLWENLIKKGFWQGEIWNKKKNKEDYLELISITSIKDIENKTTKYAAVFFDITERKKREEDIQFYAYHDPLTGLPNRLFFFEKINELCNKEKKPFILVLLDIDNFKQINDAFGHNAGDLFLRESVERIQEGLNQDDFIARLSGDEFTIIIQRKYASSDLISFI
ncbi:MAG: diguanylate cyclase, partial [Leptospiraceae bacterium]|nr:diguanylate cyclase [Leptospiraceae bacterium]